jgi:hypothetical protein
LIDKLGRAKRQLPDGTKATNKQLFAEKLWEGLTTGVITFEQGRVLGLSGQEWQALAKLVLSQVDGPAPAQVDVTSEGEAVSFSVVEIVKTRSDES